MSTAWDRQVVLAVVPYSHRHVRQCEIQQDLTYSRNAPTKGICRGNSKRTKDVPFIITARVSRAIRKNLLERHEHRNLSVYLATHETSRCTHTEGLQAVLLYRGNPGSPSQYICKAEFQLSTDRLSNGSSRSLLAAPAAASSPSSPSPFARHNIQERGLLPTKYTRVPWTSESRAVRSSSAGDNVMPSREGRIVISPRKKRGRER
jgi:hypothetical protein